MTAGAFRAPASISAGETIAALLARARREDTWPFTLRALPWTLACFLTMLWLVPFDAIQLPISLPLDAKLDRLALAVLAGLWLFAIGLFAVDERPRLRLTPLHAAAGLFFAAAVASVALNTTVLANLGELDVAAKKLVLLVSFIAFFVIVASVVRPREVPRFVTLTLGLAAVTALATVYEYRFGSNPFYSWSSRLLPVPVATPLDLGQIDNSGRTTIYGSMGHPLELALALNLALPFAVMATLVESDRGKRVRRLILTGIILAGVFSTQRKTGLVASAAGILVLFAYRPRMLRQLIPFGIVLMVLLHLLAPGTLGSLGQQLSPNRVTSVSSTQQRANDYDAITPDIRTHPALGRGFGSYDPLKYRILDNEYLGLLVTVGMVGAALYVAMLLTAMAGAHRMIRDPETEDRRRALTIAAAGSVAAFLVGSALFDVLSFPHVTYLLFFVMGLIAAGWRTRPAGPAG